MSWYKRDISAGAYGTGSGIDRLIQPGRFAAALVLCAQPTDDFENIVSGHHVGIVGHLLVPSEHTTVGTARDRLEHAFVSYVLGILPARIGDRRTNLTIAIGAVALRTGIHAKQFLAGLSGFGIGRKFLGVGIDAGS